MTNPNAVPDAFFWILAWLIVLAAVVFTPGCGPPTLDEFLAGKRIVCSVKVKVPESQRGLDEIDLSEVTLENCREKR